MNTKTCHKCFCAYPADTVNSLEICQSAFVSDEVKRGIEERATLFTHETCPACFVEIDRNLTDQCCAVVITSYIDQNKDH